MPNLKKNVVAFIGNLAGCGVMMERAVQKSGTSTKFMLARGTTGIEHPEHAGLHIGEFDVIEYSTKIRPNTIIGKIIARFLHELDTFIVLFKLREVTVVQSFTGSLFGSLVWRFAFGQLSYKPYIACATGSDIREVAMTDMGRRGRTMRSFFTKAKVTLLLNIDMMAVSDQLGLTNARFFPFAIDTKEFSPSKEMECKAGNNILPLRIFMPSNLDWGKTDNEIHRNSTKGSDRLIRAFARFVKSGANAQLFLLDRGPDRELARKMVHSLGIEASVVFKKQMNKKELIKEMQNADVIADQFDIGSIGLTSLEAMSIGKPVLVKLDEECAARCYLELPPVINVETEDDILAAFRCLEDKQVRLHYSCQSRQWIMKNHDSHVVSRKLNKIYNEITEK